MTGQNSKTDAAWRVELTPEQYHVCRQCGTEAPFAGRKLRSRCNALALDRIQHYRHNSPP